MNPRRRTLGIVGLALGALVFADALRAQPG
jgi:hypothetical protein